MRRSLEFIVVLACATLFACPTWANDGGVVPAPGHPRPTEPELPGTPVYPRESCTGPIVNGVCQGAITPREAAPKRCHGEMLNGVCTGPMF